MIDPTKTPAIVCISTDNADTLASQFRRYGFDYDVHVVHSALEGKHTTKAVLEDGSTVALYVMDSALPDATWYEAVSMMRTVVPTARRVVVTPWERFVAEGAATFRHAQAAGKIDAHLLLPRGVRDEEFHVAIGELLNDWGATAAPQVESIQVISDRRRTTVGLAPLRGAARGPGLHPDRARPARGGVARGPATRRPGDIGAWRLRDR